MEKQQTSSDYGISQELLVLSLLANYGTVSIPYGNSARYDCILDIGGQLLKIQIKSLNLIDNNTKIVVPMKNTRLCKDRVVTKAYTKDEIDYIAICYNNWIYLFKPELASGTFTVTIDKPTYYNQHWVEDYRIDKILDITIKSWESLKEQTRNENNVGGRKYVCVDCGEPVWNPNSRCVSCSRILASSNSTKPSRETLKEKIKNTPFTQIGKEYNVTDNAIRKWCKAYGLPTRVQDIKEILKKGDWDSI